MPRPALIALIAASLVQAAASVAPALARSASDDECQARGVPKDPSKTRAAADEAFDAGDYDRALVLYQELLTMRPDELHAMRRSGTLLGWQNRHQEAIQILEKAIAIDPADRMTRRQLARVKSWSGDYAGSLQMYDELIAQSPSDSETAVERARVLSWAGRLPESEQAYRRILEANPQYTNAKSGLAQTLAWAGRYGESEALYKEIAATDPTASRLGLGRLALLQGQPGVALRAAEDELARDPKNQDALRLQKEALAKLRPGLAIGADIFDDTDDNRNLTVWATGSFHPGTVDLDITAATLDQEGRDLEAQRLVGVRVAPDANGDGTADPFRGDDELRDSRSYWLEVVAGFKTGQSGRVTLSAAWEWLGSFDREAPLEERDDEATMSASAAYRLTATPVGFGVRVAHENPKWTAYITQKALAWDYVRADINGTMPWRIGWSVTGEIGRITGGVEDNDRIATWIRFWRPFELGAVTLTPRYTFRYLDYERNLNDGYFDPQDYISNLAGLAVTGRTSEGELDWGIEADAGIESFENELEDEAICVILPEPARTICESGAGAYADGNIRFGAAESDTNTVLSFLGRIAWAVNDHLTLEAYAGYTDAAAQSATGFRSRTGGVAARIHF